MKNSKDINGSGKILMRQTESLLSDQHPSCIESCTGNLIF